MPEDSWVIHRESVFLCFPSLKLLVYAEIIFYKLFSFKKKRKKKKKKPYDRFNFWLNSCLCFSCDFHGKRIDIYFIPFEEETELPYCQTAKLSVLLFVLFSFHPYFYCHEHGYTWVTLWWDTSIRWLAGNLTSAEISLLGQVSKWEIESLANG